MALPLLTLLLASPTPAQIKNWIGPANDPDWCDPDNWDPAGKPTLADDAELSGAGVAVFVQSCGAEADSVNAPDGLLVHGELVLGTGGTVHGLVVSAGANNGPNLPAGAQLVVTGTGELIDGEIQGPGSVDSQGLFTFRDGAVLSGDVTFQNHGTLQVLGDVFTSGGASVGNTTPHAIEVTLAGGANKTFGPDLTNTGTVGITGTTQITVAGEWTDFGGEITVEGAGLGIQNGTFDASSFFLGTSAIVDVGGPIELFGASLSGAGTFRIFQPGSAGTIVQDVVTSIGAASAGDKGLLIGDDVTIGENRSLENLADGLVTFEGTPIFLRGGADPSLPATMINRGLAVLLSTTNLDNTVVRNHGVWQQESTLNLPDLAGFDELVNSTTGVVHLDEGRINNRDASLRNRGRFVSEPIEGHTVTVEPLYLDAGDTEVLTGTLRVDGQMIRDGNGTTSVRDGATLWVLGGIQHGDADSTAAVLESAPSAAPTAAGQTRGVLPAHVLTTTLTSRARLAPAGPGAVGTFLLDGDFVAQSTSRLCIDIAGPLSDQVDHLEVMGDASLGGTVKVTMLGGYAPPPGTEFEILTATAGGMVSGAFSGVEGLGEWSLDTFPDRVVLSVVKTPPPQQVFADAFESGNLDEWSASVP